jgi:hypothetical protein
VKTRFKALSTIAILAFLLALLPALPAGAVEGKMTLDKTAYTSLAGQNVVVLQVEDDDLNISKSLPNSQEVVASTGGDKVTYTVANTPIRDTGIQVKSLQAGTRFLSITSLTASSGTIVMGSATTEGDAYQSLLLSSATAGALDSFAGPITTSSSFALDLHTTGVKAASNLKFTVTDEGADGTGGTTSVAIVVVGRLANVALQDIDAAAAVETTAADDTKSYAIADISETSSGTVTTSDLWTSVTSVTLTLASGASGITVAADELTSIGIKYTYDAADNTGTTTKTVKASSTSNTTGLSLSLTETTATSGKFQAEIALIDASKLSTINNLIITDNLARATDTLATLATALGTAATAASETATGANTVAKTWVEDTAAALTDVTTASVISALLGTGASGTGIAIEVAHGDTLTATYTDTASSASDTAAIDSTAPAIASFAPADKAATNDATPLLTAEVTDPDQGLNLADIKVYLNDVEKTGTAGYDTDPLTGGFRVKFTTGTMAEGSHTWKLEATDKVGNKVTKTATYTIDVTKPTLTAVATGTGIKLAATDLDADGTINEYVEYADASSIKLTFSEVLDSATLATADFDVDGGAPTAVANQTKVYDSSSVALPDDGKYVYLTVATLASDAKPKVNISASDAVADKAGNGMTKQTTATTATDSIAPTTTVTLSSALGKKDDKITVTVTVDEALSDIDVNITNKASLALLSALAMTETTTNVWSAAYTIASNVEARVTVTAKDKTPNTTTKTVDFQGDITKPTISISAVGESSGKVEEGNVWLEFTFNDASEYTGDTHKEVSKTAASLKTLDKAGGTATATEDVLAALFTLDDAKFTLAKTLGVGFYSVTITGTDVAGNAQSGGVHAFEVTARAKTSLAIKPGMNLISLPGQPSDPAINSVLSATSPVDLVMYYDNASGTYKSSVRDTATSLFVGDVATINAGKSYWVRANAAFTLSVLIPPQEAGTLPPEIAVGAGFNAVGVWDIAGEGTIFADQYFGSVSWTTAYSYDPTPGAGWAVLRPSRGDTVTSGTGYIVYVSEKGELTP